MVITAEYKFPPRPRIDSGGEPIRPHRLEDITPVVSLNYMARLWQRRRGRQYLGEEEELLSEAEKNLQLLVNQVNENFRANGIEVHLSVARFRNKYILDIYDCSDKRLCRLIGKKGVGLEDFPEFLRRLQEQVGIVLNTAV
ncbi:MAG: hypothetical protein ACQES8_08905 [Thermodesulfobacteriota bacterium]